MDICDQINEISFELQVETIFNVNDLSSFAMILKQKRKKGLKNSGLNGTGILTSAMLVH